MSDDQFMSSGLRIPPTVFVRQLRARLDELDVESSIAPRAARLRWVAGSTAVLAAAAALSFPSVRAAATAFLDYFRIVNYAPVAVQSHQLSLLGPRGIDLPAVLGQETQTLQAPAPPQRVPTPQAAAPMAGIHISVPAWRPVGLDLQQVDVSGSRSWRFTANTSRLQQVLSSLGIDDLTIPAAINGQSVALQVAPVVRIAYGNGGRQATLWESRQPVVSLPAGTDLPQLAEIALRVLGIDRAQAYEIAQSFDWRTTLMVPIPADVSNFRRVNIQGHPGLLIVTNRRTARDRRPGESSRIMWSTDDRVFALVGNLPPDQLFDMAQSIQ